MGTERYYHYIILSAIKINHWQILLLPHTEQKGHSKSTITIKQY